MDRNCWPCSGALACSTMAIMRTSDPPSPSCRSCAICNRSCRRVLLMASACSRSKVSASSVRACAMPSASSWLKRSMRRTLRAWRMPRMADMKRVTTMLETEV
ncbi:hypothetical protein D3C72_1926500 [compost metagenome]